MFTSVKTGQCGNFAYVLRNLISIDADHKHFLNLRWRRIRPTLRGWTFKSLAKSVIRFIKAHVAAKVALTLAVIGDAIIWVMFFQRIGVI